MIENPRITLNQFQSNTIAEFQQCLALIRFDSMNMYATGSDNANLGSSDTLNSSKLFIDFNYQSNNWIDCSCALNDQCLFIGCFLIQSVLQSSLECFFNQTCFDAVQFEILSNQSINIDILQANTPETLIQVLVNDLMLEQWGDQITYRQYYEQCAPELCTYTLTQHNDVSYVLTLLIGLFGGISVALKVIVPFVVRWIRNRSRFNVNPMIRPAFIHRVYLPWNQFQMKIREFNLFESELSWNDEHRRRREIRTTRIYFLLLTVGLTILIIFNPSLSPIHLNRYSIFIFT